VVNWKIGYLVNLAQVVARLLTPTCQ
jgi:hypothetical protein